LQEGPRVFQLVPNEREQLTVVPRCGGRLGNAPELQEPLIVTRDLSLTVDDEKAVGRGFERRVEEGCGTLDVPLVERIAATPLCVTGLGKSDVQP
jgi:hypothetical protein